MIPAVRRLSIRLLALACLLAAAPLHAQPLPAELYDRLNVDIVRDQIIPGYRRFEMQTGRLAEAATLYCRQPVYGNYVDLIARYHDAYDAWMGVQWLGFGPAKDRSQRIQFWPDSRNRVSRQLSNLLADPRQDLLDLQVFADASVALQGFPALERLLFADDPLEADSYGCALAVAITANLAGMAAELAAAWDPAPGTPEESARAAVEALGYPDPAALTSEFYQALYQHLEAIVTLKLARPLGETLEDARPRRGESWRSGRSIRNVHQNLLAVRGVIDNGDALGFADVVADTAGRNDVAKALRDALAEAIAKAEDLDGPLEETLADPSLRPDLVRLITAANTARERVAIGVGEAMGLVIGFNSLDGD